VQVQENDVKTLKNNVKFANNVVTSKNNVWLPKRKTTPENNALTGDSNIQILMLW